MVYAWSACRAARLRERRLLVVTSATAALGLVMIALKVLVLLHLR
ncbi:MAG TPA: hypothetical protein VGS62_05180 [Streptosporangiaceae bacterium]|nr:hypothetical protein [Streptosporangiaceae bacterium]